MATRVVIVDDDVWVRTGRAHTLAETPGIEVVAAVAHAEALERSDLWDGADVVLVDAWDQRAGFDRFPGVTVVRAVRGHPRGAAITVIVVTGHVVNELLRIRMAQAGADLFYGHEEVADAASLTAAVQTPRPAAPVGRAADRPADPEAALDWVVEHGCEPAFEGGSQKSLPLSRRAVMHVRREISERAGLGGGGGERPSWRQVARFVNRARGADLEGPGVDRRRHRGDGS